MKRALTYLLVASQIFLASVPRAWASPESDALDAAIANATQLRDDLKKNYYEHLRTTTQNMIQTQYLYTFWDHVAIRDILTSRAQTGMTRASKVRQEFSESRAKLFVAGSDWDLNASLALSRVAHMQNLSINARRIQQDAEALVNNWENACTKERTDLLSNYVNPLTYMDLIEIDAPSAPEPYFEVGAYVSTDFEGGQTQGGAAGKDGTPESGGVENLLLTGAGYAAAYVPVYGWIIAVVLVIIWALIKFGPYMNEIYKLAGKEAKLADLKDEIRRIQLNAIGRVGAETKGMVEEACAATFPSKDAKLLYREIFNDYRKQSEAGLSDLQKQSAEILTAFQERYKNLNEVYYPALKQTYLSLVDQRFEQTQKIEEQIAIALENSFKPMFSNYANAKISGGIELWNSQYEIWGATILGDASFRTEAGFSLTPPVPVEDAPAKFGNSWNTIGPKMKRIFE